MNGGSATASRTPHCPTCAGELRHEPGDFPAWLCPAGHGVAATLPAARKRVDEQVVTKVWAEAYRAPAGLRPCPFCTKPMTPVTWTLAEGEPAASVALDLCRADQLLWFDVGELEALPPQLRPADDDADQPVISHPWADATEGLPDWTERLVIRGLISGVGRG